MYEHMFLTLQNFHSNLKLNLLFASRLYESEATRPVIELMYVISTLILTRIFCCVRKQTLRVLFSHLFLISVNHQRCHTSAYSQIYILKQRLHIFCFLRSRRPGMSFYSQSNWSCIFGALLTKRSADICE